MLGEGRRGRQEVVRACVVWSECIFHGTSERERMLHALEAVDHSAPLGWTLPPRRPAPDEGPDHDAVQAGVDPATCWLFEAHDVLGVRLRNPVDMDAPQRREAPLDEKDYRPEPSTRGTPPRRRMHALNLLGLLGQAEAT